MITTMIVIALAVATISMTITQSSLFAGVRKILDHKLFHCPYCAAHWVSLWAWGCYVFVNSNTLTAFDFTINVFATVALSILPMLAIDYLNTKIDKHAKVLHSPHG